SDYRRSLAIREKLVPGSTGHAESLAALASLLRRGHQLPEAAEAYGRALDALESQTGRLGGSEEHRTSFAAKYAGYYHDALETLVEMGRTADALHVLERSRARSFRALLAERDLLFASDLPADLARERRLVD